MTEDNYKDRARLDLDGRHNNRAFFIETDALPPPDSEENHFGMSNMERGEMAFAGVLGFVDACATDDEDAVADFLCDLMHMLDRMPGRYGTFASNLSRARFHYEQEIHGPASAASTSQES